MIVPRVVCSCAYRAAKRGPGQASYCGTGEPAKSPSAKSANCCTGKRTKDYESH
jgi:hypothetical protein